MAGPDENAVITNAKKAGIKNNITNLNLDILPQCQSSDIQVPIILHLDIYNLSQKMAVFDSSSQLRFPRPYRQAYAYSESFAPSCRSSGGNDNSLEQQTRNC